MTAASPTQVALTLADLSRQLDEAAIELQAADMEAVNARHQQRVAYAKAYLAVDASNAETRKQRALLDTQTVDLAAELADAIVRDLKTRITVLRERIHVGQSYGAAVRSEWGAA